LGQQTVNWDLKDAAFSMWKVQNVQRMAIGISKIERTQEAGNRVDG
jgi:hypothetical protein